MINWEEAIAGSLYLGQYRWERAVDSQCGALLRLRWPPRYVRSPVRQTRSGPGTERSASLARHRHAKDFCRRGYAFTAFRHAVFKHGHHAGTPCGFRQSLSLGACSDEAADIIGDLEHLKEACA